MHRLIIVFACTMVLLQSPLLAQQQDEEEPFPPKHRAQPKLGGAGGFTQNLLFLDLDPINQVLASSGVTAFEKQPLLMLGGQGYGYIMIIPNLRVGGMGASGTMKSTLLDVPSNTRRDVELSVGYGGVTIDYVVPVVPRLDVALGLLLGSGGMSLKLTRDNALAKVWDKTWQDFKNTDSVYNYSQTLSGSFFVYQPSVNVEYALLRYLGLRAGVSYMGMVGSNWQVDNKFDLVGVPSAVSGKGFMVNGGIFLGTFLF
jgi:hypothetical protein